MQNTKQHPSKKKLSVDTSRIRALAAAPGISLEDGRLVFSVADQLEEMRREIKALKSQTQTLKILAGIDESQTN